MQRMPLLCPLRTTSLKAHLSIHLSLFFRPISLKLVVGPEPHPENADGSVTPMEGSWRGITTPPSTEPQTFAFVKIDLGSYYAETLAIRGPAKEKPRRAGFVLSSLSLQSRGSKVRT